jgi:hypothetical protein
MRNDNDVYALPTAETKGLRARLLSARRVVVSSRKVPFTGSGDARPGKIGGTGQPGRTRLCGTVVSG